MPANLQQGLGHLAQRLAPDRAVVLTTAALRSREANDEVLTDRDRGGSGVLGAGALIDRDDEALAAAAR